MYNTVYVLPNLTVSNFGVKVLEISKWQVRLHQSVCIFINAFEINYW